MMSPKVQKAFGFFLTLSKFSPIIKSYIRNDKTRKNQEGDINAKGNN